MQTVLLLEYWPQWPTLVCIVEATYSYLKSSWTRIKGVEIYGNYCKVNITFLINGLLTCFLSFQYKRCYNFQFDGFKYLDVIFR